jgi:hypothetical protein
MVAVRKMAHETFETTMKIVREGKVNQMVPQSLPVCTCTELHSRQHSSTSGFRAIEDDELKGQQPHF